MWPVCKRERGLDEQLKGKNGEGESGKKKKKRCSCLVLALNLFVRLCAMLRSKSQVLGVFFEGGFPEISQTLHG